MTTDFPPVSVIIPVYNGERFLAEAIDSVQRQHYAPLEIIVVDDGSSDETAVVARGYGRAVRYVYQPNQGPAAARNRGLALAGGEVIAFLDADDVWADHRLHAQVARLCETPTLKVVLGHTQFMRLAAYQDGRPQFRPYGDPGVPLQVGCGLYPRAVFDKAGAFNETLRYGEDLDWFIRVRKMRIPIVIMREVTLHYRLHEQNMTRGKHLTEMNYCRVFKMSIDRQRQGSGITQAERGQR
jgi:glycosyltransferase involved in cell wall biosynthesis